LRLSILAIKPVPVPAIRARAQARDPDIGTIAKIMTQGGTVFLTGRFNPFIDLQVAKFPLANLTNRSTGIGLAEDQ
jgi:hypothetical protein